MTVTSVQLYGVRTQFADDSPGTLARLRSIGFEVVEPFGLVDFAPQLEKALATADLTAVSAHNGLATPDDVSRALDAAELLGITTVIEPAIREGWDSEASVAAIADTLNAAAESASGRGIRIGYHNHWWEFADLGGRTALEVLAEHLSPEVVFELDLYWAAVAGVDVPALVERLESRVALLHVKDGPVTRDTMAQLPVGEGVTPIAAVLAAQPDAVRVIEFDDYAGDIFDGLATSFTNLKSMEAGR